MLVDYIQAAMRRAAYKILPDDEGFFGEIPDCQGVWANAATLEACREELQDALEGWILFSIDRHVPLPVLDGWDLNVRQSESSQEVA